MSARWPGRGAPGPRAGHAVVAAAIDRITGRYALSMMGNEVLSFDRVDGASRGRTPFEIAPAPRGVDPCESR